MDNKLKIIYKQTKDLKPYANNPRLNDDAVEYVANSIKEFGFKVPMVITSDGEIVAGHTRLKACERLGITEEPRVQRGDVWVLGRHRLMCGDATSKDDVQTLTGGY